MAWPLAQDYNEAIQNPQSNFSDPDLRASQTVLNTVGLPMPCSGNFADVYEMRGPDGKRWAVKCFTRQVSGLRERYRAISRQLEQARLPFIVEFQFLEEGIRIRGQWFPVVKMQWVQGQTLNQFVRENLNRPAVLEALGQIWMRLALRLRDAQLAHADLQHGNVLLVPGSSAQSLGLKLIDYDGMVVPALLNQPSGEAGHPAYQHPQRLREVTYHLDLDRFPLLVIATALRCLTVAGRSLWERYDNGDNLLFRKEDLEAPRESALFQDLGRLDDEQARTFVRHLQSACEGRLEEAPLLEEVTNGKAPALPVPVTTIPLATPVCTSPQSPLWPAAPMLDGTPAATGGDFDFSPGSTLARKSRHREKGHGTGAGGRIAVVIGITLAVVALVVWLMVRVPMPPGKHQDSKGPDSPKPTKPVEQSLDLSPGSNNTLVKQPSIPHSNALPLPAWVFSGKWRIDKGELVQDRFDDPAKICFGDPQWADYDVEFEAKKVEGHDCFAVVFRDTDNRSGFMFAPGNYHNSCHSLYRIENFRGIVLQQQKDRSVSFDQWHKVRVEVRGPQFTCFLDGEKVFEHSDPTCPAGMVGLHTYNTLVRFKNIQITDRSRPEPKVVMNGLPTLPEIRPPANAGSDIWRIEGDELVQTTHLSDVRLIFGNPKWADYNFEFEAMKLSGAEGFGAIFRATDFENYQLTAYGGEGNKYHDLRSFHNGKLQKNFPPRSGQIECALTGRHDGKSDGGVSAC